MPMGKPRPLGEMAFPRAAQEHPEDLFVDPIFHWPDTKSPPPVNWLVDGCFIAGTVALLSSDGGLGKSLLMQQLCTAAAIGKQWLALPTRPVRSFALFCEDDRDELWRRQRRINEHYACCVGDLENVRYMSSVGRNNIIAEFDRWSAEPLPTKLFHLMRDAAMVHGAEIIVIDTVSDAFGGNEIARDQVRAFITMLRRLAIDCKACVILTAHVSNEGLSTESGLSGSRAWNNSVRSRVWLTEKKSDESGDIRYLRTMKQNYGKRHAPLKLRYVDGLFVNETTD